MYTLVNDFVSIYRINLIFHLMVIRFKLLYLNSSNRFFQFSYLMFFHFPLIVLIYVSMVFDNPKLVV